MEPFKLDPATVRLVVMSSHDKYLGAGIFDKDLSKLVTIDYLGTVVGFVVPNQERDGRWRTGPIFIDPKYRGKGIAKLFVGKFFQGKKGRAWIDDSNGSSIGTYTANGFVATDRVVEQDGIVCREYLLG